MPDRWEDEVVGTVPVTADDRSHAKDIVLIKSDGSPTYFWSSVYDDVALRINYIIRGIDHLTNTSKQIGLFRLFGEPLPKFAHLGLICQKNKPLSKRDGVTSLLNYMAEGYDPDAMLNFLLRMGWSPSIDDKTTAVIDRDRALKMFLAEGKMRSSPANLDLAKLQSFDRKYKARKK